MNGSLLPLEKNEGTELAFCVGILKAQGVKYASKFSNPPRLDILGNWIVPGATGKPVFFSDLAQVSWNNGGTFLF